MHDRRSGGTTARGAAGGAPVGSTAPGAAVLTGSYDRSQSPHTFGWVTATGAETVVRCVVFVADRSAGPRWAVVGALVAVLLALPTLIGALPASDAETSAADLRQAALDSVDVPFAGYAESAGGLSLPLDDQLTAVADLLSDRTTMRAWYRGPVDWRVDTLSATGETGVHRDAGGTWTWEYEDAVATRAEPAPLALPSEPDLLPSSLGRRLLSEASDDELSRIGARRVAGRDALGVRSVPADLAASVARVDVWVDAASGLPLQVQLYAEGTDAAALDTRFLDLDLVAPPAATTAFTPPLGADVGSDRTSRLLDGDRLDDRARLPDAVAGLPRRELTGVPGAVGVYGRGVTLLAVVPLPDRFAHSLRDQLRASPGAVVDDLGVRVSAGPLGLMVTDSPDGGHDLLTGTVTPEALATAAAELRTTEGR